MNLWLNRSWFIRLSIALTIVSLAVLTYAGVHIYRYGDQSKTLGWAASWKQGSWMVRAVDRDGPAAGQLQPGDRILAINGDARAERIGPSWFLRERPDEQSYTILVAHDRIEIERRLKWPNRRDWTLQFWSAL